MANCPTKKNLWILQIDAPLDKLCQAADKIRRHFCGNASARLIKLPLKLLFTIHTTVNAVLFICEFKTVGEFLLN